MDPHNSAQDVHRCDLCETAIVHSYCDFCHVNLCIPCIGKHISDGYDKHKIVPFQERRSTLIYPKCETHPQKTCELQCKDCNNISICSFCTASEQHRGHIFVQISTVYKAQKETIEKDTEELVNTLSPTYEEIARDLENQLANLDGGYEKLTSAMSKQGEQWHREIDIIINKMKTEISEIKVKHRDVLKKHLDEIKQTQSLIKQTLRAINEIEKSTEVSPTIAYSSKIREFSTLPPKIQVSLPTFIPKPIDREKLYSLFGQITQLSTATEKNVLSLHQPKTSVRELLDEPEIVTTIQTGHEYLRSVACLNDGSIWTSGKTNDIKCFNSKGSLFQTVKQKSGNFPNDIAVDSDGDLLYISGTTGTVNKVKNGQTEEMIRLLEWTPSKLCVTSTGDLLVTMFSDNETQSKVVRYSGSTEKQTIQFDDKGTPLYSGNGKIKYITENRNHDICVADWKAGEVVVVNQDGKLRWRYTGHLSVTKNQPFIPCGITTDSQSRILTADGYNHCIHILDQNGQFLRYIDNCDLMYPYGLCVDNNDNLFVCELTMDPHNSAQDVHRCDLCETAIVHSYCDFCHVNLCKPCVVDHISDGYDKHKIVPFKERRSTLIYPKCETHPQKMCELQCKDCNNISICSFCTASEQHRGHTFVQISNVYKAQKKTIEKDTEELVNTLSPTYEEIARDLENQLANLDGGYEKLTSAMSKQGEQWHREIDFIINKTKTEISEIKVKHRDILQKHLNEIKQIQSLIKQSLRAIHEIEKSTEVSLTIAYSSKIREFSKLPPKIQVSMPTFIPKPIDREKLYSLFGQIMPLSTAAEGKVLSLHQPKTSVRELLDKPKRVATIQTGHERLRNVTCLNDGSIWTSGMTNDIKCFNSKGSLLQTVKQKSGKYPNAIAVYSDEDLLYTSGATKTVYKVKSDQTEELIRLQGWTPGKLCVTSTGDLLVTMFSKDGTQSKVVRYSGSTEKQTIQFEDEGKPLYSGNSAFKYITENRNHDICVADCEAGAVVVVNQDGKLRWRYTSHPSVTKNEPFVPWGITTDSQSHVLTADIDNHCIHIVDQNGQFLRYIDNCDLKYPTGLCVDNNDNLFVCELNEGNVKKIKYLK
ncbi:uncharacterized protein LOC128160358 [Crassostrea angulata]|uniref:uncharacterized protein LOC128160358 n=1 Tax=Magallana angulata TaxID=2784310 RepID=UPI0022B0A776|nr:uncharacterized protein LOC128160358 [Crassostrea angulata]